MADVLPEQGRELHRLVDDRPGSVEGMLQRLDKLFEQFWHKIEARKQYPHPQQQVRRRSDRNRTKPGSSVSKTPSKAPVHPQPNLPRLRAAPVTAAKHVPRQQSRGTRIQRRITPGPRSIPAERELTYPISWFHGSRTRALSQTRRERENTLAYLTYIATPRDSPKILSRGIG
ncbi:Hypothetical predicted protein [Pelobates cultripes]|uniref:Uncharacterized protein n=1 Tax=Pelobates cultripes TaxID=61616 RepID=A0AAD1RXN7_PELCU|nr:Hypothetical predicted protein [Pelobates cultripes]